MYATAKQDGQDFKKTILGLRQEMKGVIDGMQLNDGKNHDLSLRCVRG
jgi:hypothetical protein